MGVAVATTVTLTCDKCGKVARVNSGDDAKRYAGWEHVSVSPPIANGSSSADATLCPECYPKYVLL